MKDFTNRMRDAKSSAPSPKESAFVRFADWISTAMGTPANIIFWIVLVVAWIALFALHVLGPDSQVLPSWFTSNAFNFPLNTVTTLAELYIGFLIAAAANRVEKKNRQLHERMMGMVESEEKEIEELLRDEKAASARVAMHAFLEGRGLHAKPSYNSAEVYIVDKMGAVVATLPGSDLSVIRTPEDALELLRSNLP